MSYYDQDFKEIAHCGANTTIHISCDEEGRKSAAFGIVHRSPGPMTAIGIYILLPQGIPVCDFRMGGIGQPFDPPPPKGTVPAILGSDSMGYWGHQCPQCNGYFRNRNHAAVYPQTCPYCGLRTEASHFLTPAQRMFLAHLAATLETELEAPDENGTERQVEIDMATLVKQSAKEPKPSFYYASQTQQTRYSCEHCGEFNDIRGLYGYCAACGWRNNVQMLAGRLSEIRAEVNSERIRPEAAVGQSVSTFDAACRDFANQMTRRIPMKPTRQKELSRLVFHDTESETFKRMKQYFDLAPLKGIQEKDVKFIRMMMERRHVYEHNSGVIDQRYIERSGDADAIEGNLLREGRDNVHRLIGLLTRIVANVDKDFHEIFTPTKWPIEHYGDLKKRRAKR